METELEFPDGLVALAYCTVMAHDSLCRFGHLTDELQATCDNVDCRTCNLLGRLLEFHVPEPRWVCSDCTSSYEFHPGFWADGACDDCGRESPVLQLVEPSGNLKRALQRMRMEVEQ